MNLLKLLDWVKSWLSVILVVLAVILLTVAQWLDEGPVIYWMRSVVVELVKGLETTAPESGVWIMPVEGQPIQVVGRKAAKE